MKKKGVERSKSLLFMGLMRQKSGVERSLFFRFGMNTVFQSAFRAVKESW